MIDFDRNATTPLLPQALAAMNEVYKEGGNASSLHALGRRAAMRVERVRDDLCLALNAKNYDVFFTATGTEANNIALRGNFAQIFLGKIEHSSVYNVRPQGVEFIEFVVDENGVIDLPALKNTLEKNVKNGNFLLSLMLANSESGAIQPIKEVAKIVHQFGGLIHSDIVAALGKMPIDLEDLNVDFASVSAHKIGGPQGAAALLARRGLEVQPIIFGGGQEKNKRSGTLNNAAITGFGEAIKNLPSRISAMKEIAKNRDFIESELKKIAGENIMFFSQSTPRLANTSFYAVKNLDNQTQLIHFDLNKIAVSNGSACSSGTLQKSRLLQAINAKTEFLNPIRISLGPENTMDEAQSFVKVFKEFYLRNHSKI